MSRTIVYAHPSTYGGRLIKVYLADVVPEEVVTVARAYRQIRRAGASVVNLEAREALWEALAVMDRRLQLEEVPCD